MLSAYAQLPLACFPKIGYDRLPFKLTEISYQVRLHGEVSYNGRFELGSLIE